MTTTLVHPTWFDEVIAAHRPPFAERVPEPDERQSEAENASFTAWVRSPLVRALYAGIAAHVLSRANPPRGARILCVAEGEGTLARALGRMRPDARVLGTDVAPDMVTRALQTSRPSNVEFQVASAYELQPVAPADLVVCALSFHHLQPARALRELVSAVSPGGALFLLDLRRDMDEACYYQNLLDQVDPIMARLSARSAHAAHTIAELSEHLRAAAPTLHAEVGRVEWAPEAAAAFLREGRGEPLPAIAEVRARIAGLWLEALVRVPV